MKTFSTAKSIKRRSTGNFNWYKGVGFENPLRRESLPPSPQCKGRGFMPREGKITYVLDPSHPLTYHLCSSWRGTFDWRRSFSFSFLTSTSEVKRKRNALGKNIMKIIYNTSLQQKKKLLNIQFIVSHHLQQLWFPDEKLKILRKSSQCRPLMWKRCWIYIHIGSKKYSL